MGSYSARSLGRTQKFDIGDPFQDKAPEAEVSTAEQSEANEPNKPKETIKKPEDDDKPEAKEAETVKLPDFPNPETYRSWKISVREAVRAASDKPDEAFKWVQEVYDRTASMERETGKFLTLDAKILQPFRVLQKGIWRDRLSTSRSLRPRPIGRSAEGKSC